MKGHPIGEIERQRRAFVDAMREVLRKVPLYDDRRERPETERFYIAARELPTGCAGQA